MNKKIKSLLSLMLVLCLSTSLLLPVWAQEEEEEEKPEVRKLTISSMEDFNAFSKNCVRDIYSQNLEVSLKTDLHFEGLPFEAVPSFSGTFLGNHHSITGIHLETEGSNQGMFRYLTGTAVVRDLQVSGEILPKGSRKNTGGIAGSNAGRILGCHFKGQVAGTDFVGGIAGTNEIGGILEDCTVSGSIRGIHFAGGLAGANYGVVRKSENSANVNVKEEDNKIDSVSFDKDFLMGKESVETSTDLGGIVGTNSGVIRSCANHGNVGYPRMGYNLGGICGSQKGYVVGCKNEGTIQGRKEIAGIAGQLEPVMEIDFQEDTIQILKRQLNETSALANRAANNISANAQDLRSDIDSLHGYAGVAMDAVQSLIPQDGILPDHDTIIAAHSALSSSVGGMHGSLSSINSSAQSMVGTAAADIRAINNSVREISETLDNAADTLGGTVVDISDLDTEEDLEGKIQDCRNTGFVSGDLNVGGIVGASAWENDKDPEEDFTVAGDRSLNFDSRLRAVILNCENSAKIQVNKRNGGGIVGNLSLGLARNCRNTGFVEGEKADYIGGIAGTSLGFLRSCSVKSQLTGHSFLGGIAGAASIASDCRSTVLMDGSGEKLGSVLGDSQEDRSESEQPLKDNYYLPLSDHLGAIDGIDYYGVADSLEKTAFMELQDLPSMFYSSTMTFLFPDGSTQQVTVPLGTVVQQGRIPQPPRKEGMIGSWDLLKDLDLNHMFFDVILEPEYESSGKVLESTQKRQDGNPVMLAEGSFGQQKTMELQPASALPQKNHIGSGWALPDFGTKDATRIHLTIPEEMDVRDARALVQEESGAWREAESSEDGTYLIFSVNASDQAVAIYESQARRISQIAAVCGGGAGILILLIVLLILRKKKKAAKK